MIAQFRIRIQLLRIIITTTTQEVLYRFLFTHPSISRRLFYSSLTLNTIAAIAIIVVQVIIQKQAVAAATKVTTIAVIIIDIIIAIAHIIAIIIFIMVAMTNVTAAAIITNVSLPITIASVCIIARNRAEVVSN